MVAAEPFKGFRATGRAGRHLASDLSVASLAETFIDRRIAVRVGGSLSSPQ